MRAPPTARLSACTNIFALYIVSRVNLNCCVRRCLPASTAELERNSVEKCSRAEWIQNKKGEIARVMTFVE